MRPEWLFRVSLLLCFFICFLNTPHLPEGLFTAKEVGLYIATVVSGLSAIYILVVGLAKTRFLSVDILLLILLVGIPSLQWLFLNQQSLNGLIYQLCLLLCYFSIRILSSSIRVIYIFNIIIEVVTLTLFFSILIAISQTTGIIPSAYSGTIVGLFFNPGPFAIHLAALTAFMGFMILYYLYKRKYLSTALFTLMVGISLYFILSSMSRSAWIGLFTSGVFILICVTNWYIKKKNSILFKKISVLIVIIAYISIPVIKKTYKLKKESADGRSLIWKTSWIMAKENALLGVGTDKFGANYLDYQSKAIVEAGKKGARYSALAGDVRYAFNDFLQVFAEKGLLGLCAVLSLLLILSLKLIALWKNQSRSKYSLVSAIAASIILITILSSGLTSYPLQMLPISVLFWVMLAILSSLVATKGSKSDLNVSIQQYLASLILAIVIIIGGYSFNKTKAYWLWGIQSKQNINHIKTQRILMDHPIYLFDLANQAIREKEYLQAIIYLKRTIAYGSYPQYYYELGKCYEEVNQPDKALAAYTKVKNAIPNLLTPYYLEAKLHYRFANKVEFNTSILKALELKPKIDNEQVRIMQQELQELLKIQNTSLQIQNN